jgi:hypothetical protein
MHSIDRRMQFDQIQSVSGFVEFGPLVKASGQNVPRNQLKNAVIKTIDILISSDPTDRSTGTLNITKLILQNVIQRSGFIVPQQRQNKNPSHDKVISKSLVSLPHNIMASKTFTEAQHQKDIIAPQ